MTPEQQVVADATTTLQDACAAAGVPSPMDQLTAANASLTTATNALNKLKADVAALLGAFDTLRADAGV